MTSALPDTTQITQPALWWPEFNTTVTTIAMALGLLLLIIAYFAGARDNQNKIIFSIFTASLIGFLSMPLFIKLGEILGVIQNRWGRVGILTLAIIFVATVSSHVYEIITVSAREARPPE
jgi:uncharacterized membrane protein